jgi:hypothetical protein
MGTSHVCLWLPLEDNTTKSKRHVFVVKLATNVSAVPQQRLPFLVLFERGRNVTFLNIELLLAGLLPRGSGFDTRAVRVGYVIGNVPPR